MHTGIGAAGHCAAQLLLLVSIGLAGCDSCAEPKPLDSAASAPVPSVTASTSENRAPATEPRSIVRFVALGDAGEGNATQYRVADAIDSVCHAAGGCDFALYLGDNFYNVGVTSASDAQFQTKFELPYSRLTFPFFAVLGNHDYGGGGAGYEFHRGLYQIEYAARNPESKWKLPAQYYVQSTRGLLGRDKASIDLIGLDTNEIMYGQADAQKKWLLDSLGGLTGNWKIAFGHHTFISNGVHGDAGEYGGLSLLPIINGENVERFFRDAVCGKVDVYLCGHDHNLQWLKPTCGTEFIVSGAGAKVTPLEPRDTPTFFQEDKKPGFILIEIAQGTLTGTFYSSNAETLFRRTIQKPHRAPEQAAP